MFDAETVTFLEGGCSLIVGSSLDGRTPLAARAWGLDVVSPDTGLVRLVFGARHTHHLGDGSPIAVTGADVLTLRSLQIKGRTTGVRAAGDDDLARVVRYCDAFFGDVMRIDGTPRELLDRLTPATFAVCELRAESVFDQTPGPEAGRPVVGDPR